jgi:myo-inositol 2-dehydrogenase/D-chiro-inositol 1-dehydrogenase
VIPESFMRIGIIGLGRIGLYHARILSQHAGVTGLVVADTLEGRAREGAEELGAELADSVDDLLGRVDAVLIATSTDTHAALIHAGVDAGLPTFCEKPVALDLASTTEVVEHVRRAGATVQIGFQRRFDAGYQAARKAVTEGGIGRVYVVRIAAHDPYPPHEGYLPGSGGIFRDMHIHDFDIVRWVLGRDVVEVYAQGAVLADPMFERHGDVDTVAATLTFEGGTLGVMTGARHDPLGCDVRLEIFGSGDSVAVGWDTRTPLRSLEPGMPPAPDHPYTLFLDRFDAAYRRELAAFVDLARTGGPSPCSVEDAQVALRVALACDLSHREHRPVRVDEVGP